MRENAGSYSPLLKVALFCCSSSPPALAARHYRLDSSRDAPTLFAPSIAMLRFQGLHRDATDTKRAFRNLRSPPNSPEIVAVGGSRQKGQLLFWHQKTEERCRCKRFTDSDVRAIIRCQEGLGMGRVYRFNAFYRVADVTT